MVMVVVVVVMVMVVVVVVVVVVMVMAMFVFMHVLVIVGDFGSYKDQKNETEGTKQNRQLHFNTFRTTRLYTRGSGHNKSNRSTVPFDWPFYVPEYPNQDTRFEFNAGHLPIHRSTFLSSAQHFHTYIVARAL